MAEKWRVNRDMEEMRRRFDEDVVRPIMRAVWDRVPEEVKTWSPAVDMYEKGDNLMIRVEIPGLRQEDIDVYVTEDMITLKGERKREPSVKDEDYFKNEIISGSFYRSLTLPFPVDTKSIEAVYEEGILRLVLERAAGSKPRKITVQVKKQATAP